MAFTAVINGGKGVVGQPGDVHLTARNTLGTRATGIDTTGNTAEYIYLAGCASGALGSTVTYDEAGVTTLIAGNAKGPVAISTAVLSSATVTFGWYMIQGTILALFKANSADNTTVGFETTAGYIGDGRSAGDQMANSFARGATAGADALCLVQIDHPYVDDFMGA